jgi:hypothetical protein
MSDLAGTADVIANVDGEDSYVRIQMPTNAGALDRGKQLAVVDRATTIAADAAAAAADRTFAGRTWVLPTEAPDGAGISAGRRTRTTCWWLPPGRRWGCPAARDPEQVTRLRTNSASFWRPMSIWLMEEP